MIHLTQCSWLKDILKQKDWMITQFGEKEISDHLFGVIEKLEYREYNLIKYFLAKRIETNKIRKMLIDKGLKPLTTNI